MVTIPCPAKIFALLKGIIHKTDAVAGRKKRLVNKSLNFFSLLFTFMTRNENLKFNKTKALEDVFWVQKNVELKKKDFPSQRFIKNIFQTKIIHEIV